MNDDTRMRQFLNDPYLKKLGEEMTRIQHLLFAAEVQVDEATGERKIIARPLIANAFEIVNKLQKQMNDYRNQNYSDLFPGK